MFHKGTNTGSLHITLTRTDLLIGIHALLHAEWQVWRDIAFEVSMDWSHSGSEDILPEEPSGE